MKYKFLPLLLAVTMTACLSKPTPWSPSDSFTPKDGFEHEGQRRTTDASDAGGLPEVTEIVEIIETSETVDAAGDVQDIKWDACEPAICESFPGQCGDLDDGCGGIIKCDCGEFGSCKLSEGTCKCDHEQCVGVCCGPDDVCFQEACCLGKCEGTVCGDDGCGGRVLRQRGKQLLLPPGRLRQQRGANTRRGKQQRLRFRSASRGACAPLLDGRLIRGCGWVARGTGVSCRRRRPRRD